ncbi:MAG: AraC family transcriptional regulator [Clostridiales bacterium]|nr:AraC family transcriptional regulator [Clostridiales bacterium]
MKITDVKKESWPACRLIGKRGTDWGQWWGNDWFAPLERQPALPENGDAYIGAVRVAGGVPERWIGMFFPAGAAVPAGYEAVDIPAKSYAVCYLRDKEGSGDFYTMETHERCLAALKEQGFTRSEDDWCFERYNCPRFTAPDGEGNVVLDYGVAIE